jgi:hypothetical protein
MSFIAVRIFIPFILLLSLVLTPIPALAAADPVIVSVPAASIDSHVRTNQAFIRSLIHNAMNGSVLFRTLVDRLNRSDVIVYVTSDHSMPSTVEGRMTFVGTAGGRRYVVVSLAWGRSDLRAIATLGHELQHAVEVAETPEIIDAPSLARSYAEFGFPSHGNSNGAAYDTHAALDAGERVWEEMNGHPGKATD